MDIEQLTKHQIVLLTLLVSFVTSIATGIVTVSLMDQAPAGVTKIVNQIVEHTVETVAPQAQSAAAANATEKTVVVKDDDLTAQSIASVQKGIVRIVKAGGKDLVARGVIIKADGTALSDAGALDASGTSSYEAILASGARVAVTSISSSTSSPVATLSLAVGTSTGFAPAALGDAAGLKLGQTVIRIGGAGADTVGSGVVASLPLNDDGLQTLVEASVSSATPGSLLITLFGQVVGITTGVSSLTGNDFYSTLSSSGAPSAPAAASQ